MRQETCMFNTANRKTDITLSKQENTIQPSLLPHLKCRSSFKLGRVLRKKFYIVTFSETEFSRCFTYTLLSFTALILFKGLFVLRLYL